MDKPGKEERMFNVGEFVVFGTDGVCMIEKIGALEMEGVAKDKQYYTLSPVGTNGRNRIFAPVDGKRVVMRRILSSDEAENFVSKLDDIGRLKIPDERKREETYKAVLQSCDYVRITEMIKEIYARRKERAAAGKKLPSVDERYFTAAENSLYSELELSLNMGKDELRSYLEKAWR